MNNLPFRSNIYNQQNFSSSSSSSSSSNMNNPTNSKWIHLPTELLHHILTHHLNLNTDLPRLRAVCPAWRSALPLHLNRRCSLHAPPLPAASAAANNLPLLLFQTRFCFLSPPPAAAEAGASGGLAGRWLARIGDIEPTTNTTSQRVHLFNPVSLRFRDYFHSEPPLTASLNLLHFPITELAAPFSLARDSISDIISQKVVGGWGFGNSGFAVLVLIISDQRLLVWRSGETTWTDYTQRINNDDSRILDIASHGGKFYALKLREWRVWVIDPSNPSSMAIQFVPAPHFLVSLDSNFYPYRSMIRYRQGVCYVHHNSHLVSAANGRLYMLVEAEKLFEAIKSQEVVTFVFVLNQWENVWEQVDNLGDQIFFIGHDVAFSLLAASANLPQWRPNSVCMFMRYMEDDSIYEIAQGVLVRCPDYRRCFRVVGMGEEQGEERGAISFTELSDEVYTGLFFPPPASLQWRCPSLGNLQVRFDHL